MTILEKIEQKIEEEYEFDRKPLEHTSWVSEVLEMTIELTAEDLNRSRNISRVREEAFPISRFFENYDHGFEKIQLKNGSQNYDAQGVQNGNDVHVEITCVKDGQFDLYQAIHMDKFGSAPASGRSTQNIFDAVKSDQIIYGEAEFVSNEVDKCIEGANTVIRKKLDKDYPDNTILIVGVDGICFVDTRHWDGFISKLSIDQGQNKFKEVYVVSFHPGQVFKLL